jgi:hypothetical protein
MSGLATVTYTLVSMVMRHGLSQTQPCVTRLVWPFLHDGQCMMGALMYNMLASPIFRWHPPFPNDWPSLLLSASFVSWLPSGPYHQFPCVSEVFHLISSAGHRFLPPSHRGSHPGSGLASHRSSTPVFGGLMVWWWGGMAHTECPCALLPEPQRHPSFYI